MNPKNKISYITIATQFFSLLLLFFLFPFSISAEMLIGKPCSGLGDKTCDSGDMCVQTGGSTIGGKATYSCVKEDTVPHESSYNNVNDTMPKFNIPDIKLQIDIPGLTLTKGSAIKCSEQNGKKVCNFPWIGEYIAGIYKYAIGIVGILAAVVLMVGGVLWIIAGGSATMIGEAKAWIGASLTGLIIALCSYAILYQVNPALVNFNGLNITLAGKIKKLVEQRTSATSEQFKNMPCPSAAEFQTGVDFYATGYIKPANDNSKYSLCMIAMNCSCPDGQDESQNCDEYFANYKNYRPCKSFSGNNYCNKNSSGKEPRIGDVAVDYNCINKEQQICVNKNGEKTTYTARDSGGGIKGRRIDIWSGDDISEANKNSGVVNVSIGACQ